MAAVAAMILGLVVMVMIQGLVVGCGFGCRDSGFGARGGRMSEGGGRGRGRGSELCTHCGGTIIWWRLVIFTVFLRLIR